jgi:hypothetical protein
MRWDPRTVLVVALLVVMVVVLAIEAVDRSFGPGGAFNDRCVAAGGHVKDRGAANRATCIGDDDSEITLP